MRFGWRAISGPVLTAATLLLTMLLDRVIPMPSPVPLLVGIVALAGALSGLASAVTSATIGVIGATLFLISRHGVSPSFADLVQLGLLAITVAGTAGVTGLMRERLLGTFAAERRSHATAARLSAALDQVDIGIVLLDAETRAEFINRAFRDYFALPDEIADGKPPFIALMYHGRATPARSSCPKTNWAPSSRSAWRWCGPAMPRRSTSPCAPARCCASSAPRCRTADGCSATPR